MSAVASEVEFESTITWPVRAAIAPFSCGLQDKYPASVKISFPATYAVTAGVLLFGVTWTSVEFQWKQPFVGGREAANTWLGTASGEAATLAQVEKLSALLIDALRATHAGDRNLAVLRSFGIRDWPYYSYGVAGEARHVRIGVHAEAQFRGVPTALFGGGAVSLTKSTSFTARAMLRASDLAEGGYPTEAVLIAFGALDAAIQSFLVKALQRKGVAEEAARAMLRNITTKRLATYLDGVLMLACGRSLAEDAGLFKALIAANAARNDAIHNGIELNRIEAVRILKSIANVLIFMRGVDPTFEPGFTNPGFFY